MIGDSIRFGPVALLALKTLDMFLGPLSLDMPSRDELVALEATTELKDACCCWKRRIADRQPFPARVSRSAIWPIRQSATLSAMLGV
eukprot:3401956-Pyramimonas_sp.AAC.1